jgi:predicted GIY-YIG superfamily endonuclease
VIIHRRANATKRLVYVAVANKPYKYPYGRSRILYIGSTKKGSSRVAASAAAKAKHLLNEHGVRELEFYTVNCTARQRVKTWMKLERSLLLSFRERFGEVPIGNTHGRKMKWTDELSFFTRRRLNAVLDKYS